MSIFLMSYDMSIKTYGGGVILKHLFESISMMMQAHDGWLGPVTLICAYIGGFWALSKALFSGSYQPLLIHYLYPVLIVGSLFMLPKTKIHIEDVLARPTQVYSVDNVPFVLGKFAELVSSIGYGITSAFEQVMQKNNNTAYNSTGMIFGAENSLEFTHFQLTNANLEQNLRTFAKQCVLYDVALGRYSYDELKKSTDLWDLFKQKTSKVRMVRYCPPDGNVQQCTYLSCREAINSLQPYFDKEKEHYAKLEIGKNLPFTFQHLTKIQKEGKNLISQQLMMNVLSDEYSGSKFAQSRALAQQQATYETIGSFAGKSLITMRVIFEALIYVSFILILPMCVIPGGLKFLSNWAWLVIWIQLWPPFFVILSYVIEIAAYYKYAGIFGGLATSEQGLSLFTNAGMLNLNSSIIALAGYLSLSVPYLSYVILNGGLSSLVNLASTLMTPVHQASSTSAAEQATGNYSFANASMDQSSYANANAFQTNSAPSFASGYFTDHQGSHSTTYKPGAPIFKQHNSDLIASLSTDDALSQSYHHSIQEAKSTMQSAQNSYMDSMSSYSKTGFDWCDHVASSKNFNENLTSRESSSVQQSARDLQSMASNWGQQYGLNARESLEGLVGVSAGGSMVKNPIFNLGVDARGSFNRGASRDEMINSALQVAQSEDFQTNLQTVNDYAKSLSSSSSNDEGSRLANNYAQSLDTVKSEQTSYQDAENNLKQVSENAAWAQQNTSTIRKSLNQDFVEWGGEKFANSGSYSGFYDILSNGSEEQQQNLIQEYVSELRDNMNLKALPINETNLKVAFESNFLEKEGKALMGNYESYLNQESLNLGHVKIRENEITKNYEEMDSYIKDGVNRSKERTTHQQDEALQTFEDANSRYLLGRFVSGPKGSDITEKISLPQKPFWIESQDTSEAR